MEAMLRIPGLRFRAVCDIWTEYNLRRVVNTLKRFKQEPNGYEDYREMLDKEKQLDAVIIATPDFWHAQHTIDALKAGKHVYCEKEMSNTLEGARSMVLAQRETGKLLQIGHQRRSNPRYLHCYHKLLGEAKLLGRIVTVNGQWNRAVAPDLGAPDRYAIPAGHAEAVRVQGHASVPQLALVQGPRRRTDRRSRLAPDRHLQLVPRRAPLWRDGQRRAALPRPEDARVARHGHGRLRLRHAGGAGQGVLPDADDQRQPGLLRELHGRPGDAAHLRVGAELRRSVCIAIRTRRPGTSGSRKATSARRRSRR